MNSIPPADNDSPSSEPSAAEISAPVEVEFDRTSPPEEATALSETPDATPLPRRRWALPLFLFVATCFSTFWVGAAHWLPGHYISAAFGMGESVGLQSGWMPARQAIVTHWADGLLYMGCVVAILLTHEMGHFVATLWYRIPASYPIFLPLPISPIGTLGAVIGMDGSKADRKQTFDIGIAGPLAGLVLAVPILWIGVANLDLTQPEYGGLAFNAPLGVELLLRWIQPPGFTAGTPVVVSQLNSFYMAGWIGCLITGLNMAPVSQLDGGHVTYGLLGKKSFWVARAFLVAAIAYSVYTEYPLWGLMIVLVLLMGSDHPKTRNDDVPLGWPRIILGALSLVIPILCLPLQPIVYLD